MPGWTNWSIACCLTNEEDGPAQRFQLAGNSVVVSNGNPLHHTQNHNIIAIYYFIDILQLLLIQNNNQLLFNGMQHDIGGMYKFSLFGRERKEGRNCWMHILEPSIWQHYVLSGGRNNDNGVMHSFFCALSRGRRWFGEIADRFIYIRGYFNGRGFCTPMKGDNDDDRTCLR